MKLHFQQVDVFSTEPSRATPSQSLQGRIP